MQSTVLLEVVEVTRFPGTKSLSEADTPGLVLLLCAPGKAWCCYSNIIAITMTFLYYIKVHCEIIIEDMIWSSFTRSAEGHLCPDSEDSAVSYC